MATARKVIITCAVTGSASTHRSMSPHLPVTPNEIAEAAIGAARSGRHGACTCTPGIRTTGHPTQASGGVPASSCRASSNQTNAVVNITTGGGPWA